MPTLRKKQTAAARSWILEAAFELLTHDSERAFSHENVALRAGIGIRTVYRYFPTQADLFQGLWELLRERIAFVFPSRESEIVELSRKVLACFDRHQKMVRATLSSAVGTRIQAHEGGEAQAAFAKSLVKLLRRRPSPDRKRVVAVFVAVYSASFWQLLRDRGGLSGPDAQAAVTWTMKALLSHLRRGKIV